jgi:hypothetical protein
MITRYYCRSMVRFALVSIILIVFFGCSRTDEINLTTLLKEMADREQLANFPEPGYRCLQASSYNRESVSSGKPGWFADSDGTGFIRTEINNGREEWVIMEDQGPGAITKIWAVCFYYGLEDTIGANVRFYLDGATEPVISTNFFSLVKGQDFVRPPFAVKTTRAGNLYFPVPYAKSCKITMDKKAFYNIVNYRKYPEGTPVRSFTMGEYENVAGLREKIGKVLRSPSAVKGKKITKEKVLQKGERLLLELPKGSHAIKELRIKISQAKDYAQALRSTILAGKFDQEETVWCPAGDFFNNVGKSRPYEMWERSVTTDSTMICRWVMPYEDSGAVCLENLDENPVKVTLSVVSGRFRWKESSMHFYASWRMDPPGPTFPLYDWNFLSAKGKGVIVGDEWTVLNPEEGWWGEGDEKIYVDDDIRQDFPSHFGTGTEDYYGWAGGIVPTPGDEFSKPFLGNIIVAEPNSKGYNVCTRTRALDAIPFREQIRFDFESSCGTDTRKSWFFLQYAQTTFWYGTPGVTYNRKPMPEMASRKLPTVDDLQELMAEARGKTYFAEGAIEAEQSGAFNKSPGVTENLADIPVWGEMSGGLLKNLWFEQAGDFAEFKITEQFKKSAIKIAAAVGKSCGKFDIYVNGRLIGERDLYSSSPGIINPLIDLGENEPVDNAFVIRFVYKDANSQARPVNQRSALGIDYFLTESF